MARFAPIPDPDGSLDPPRRPPPTALACAAPYPEPQDDGASEHAYQSAVAYCATLLRRLRVLRQASPAQWIGRVMRRLVSRGARTVQSGI